KLLVEHALATRGRRRLEEFILTAPGLGRGPAGRAAAAAVLDVASAGVRPVGYVGIDSPRPALPSGEVLLEGPIRTVATCTGENARLRRAVERQHGAGGAGASCCRAVAGTTRQPMPCATWGHDNRAHP